MCLLKVHGLTKEFGGLVAVKNCSFNLVKGTILGLIGPNGSGKTTIFNLITGFLKPDGGEIYLKDMRINDLEPYQIARKGIGRTFQLTRVFKRMSVLSNMLTASPQQLTLKESEGRALELLRFVGLSNLRNEYAENLSYGQQKLLDFARLLMLDFDLILLDEPVAGINPVLANKMLGYIGDLHDQGKTFFIIEHNIRMLTKISDRIIVLDSGEKIVEGTPEEIQRDEKVRKAYFLQ